MKKGDIVVNEEGATALVKWVIGDEAGLEFTTSKLSVVATVSLGFWKVHISMPPSYQSMVENMTTEELRESIDILRSGRALLKGKIPSASKASRAKASKEKVPVMSAEDRAMVKLFGNMTPEQMASLKQKLAEKAGGKV